jgi:hypothetical protein
MTLYNMIDKAEALLREGSKNSITVNETDGKQGNYTTTVTVVVGVPAHEITLVRNQSVNAGRYANALYIGDICIAREDVSQADDGWEEYFAFDEAVTKDGFDNFVMAMTDGSNIRTGAFIPGAGHVSP